MSNPTRTLEDVKNCLQSCKSSDSRDRVNFYNTWADKYDEDLSIADYKAPSLAVNCLMSRYDGERDKALVLDVACGTGLVGRLMSKLGFRHFVGVDGSRAMLDQAGKTGLYQDLMECLLGSDPMAVQAGSFDVVMCVGGFGVGHVPVSVVRELYQATKPGGYVCMTRGSHRTAENFKEAMEREMSQMEEEGLWSCLMAQETEKYMRDLTQQGTGYLSGSVYLYRRSSV